MDLTPIDGIHVMTAQTVYAELGADLGAAFPNEDHFASWLMLAPQKRCERGPSHPPLLHALPQPGGRKSCVWRPNRSMTVAATLGPAIVPYGDDSDVGSKL